MDLPDLLQRVWRAATTAVAEPASRSVLCAGLAALLVVGSPLWQLARHGITIAHEGGHAIIALLSGRRLHGVSLHSDTSGLTRSAGPARGVGLILTMLAGYPAAGFLGLGAAALLSHGYQLGLLWALVALLAVLILAIRNLFGFFVVLVVGALLVGAATYLPATVQSSVAYFLAWLLLLGAVRAVFELAQRPGRRGAPVSDAAQLAQLTRLPTAFWVAIFFLLTGGTAALGAWLLWP